LPFKTARRYLVSVLCFCLSLCAIYAQEESGDSATPAKLKITIDAHGAARVELKVFDRSLPTSLGPVMSQALGCALIGVKENDAEGDRLFSALCEHAFLKRGLLVAGVIQLAPLIDVLKQANVAALDTTIVHPRTAFSEFREAGWGLETTPQSVAYSRKLLSAAAPAGIPLAFGYRLMNFLPLTLLLFPIGLTLVMRWAAVRARNWDPIVVWFTYWRLFGWVMFASWLLWIQGSKVIDCSALARFLLNGDSASRVVLQVAMLLVPAILVQLICTVASGRVLAQVSGQRWVLPVSLKHAFWHEPVNIWPLLLLLAGVASLALYNEFVLGPICLAAAYASRVVLLRLWFRFQDLRRYELPPGELRSSILALAQKTGVTLKEIYLLPSAEGRLGGPYMIRGRRLLVSEAMLRFLEKRETEAVLARALVHQRRYHYDIIAAIAVTALPVIYRFSHLGLVAGALPWAIRGPLLVWLTPVFLYLLWRRFERVAVREAATVTGDAEAFSTALPRIAQLNIIGLYWRRFEWRFFPNRTNRDRRPNLPALPVAP
jgi:Zn-dependent protease with chaperone function